MVDQRPCGFLPLDLVFFLSLAHALMTRSVIESSPEKGSRSRGEIELTPPPEMSEAKKAEIAQAVQYVIPISHPTMLVLADDILGVQSLYTHGMEEKRYQIQARTTVA